MPLSLRDQILFDCCSTCAFSLYKHGQIYCPVLKAVIDFPEDEFCEEYK